jgi:hypothetical protein
MIVVFDTNIWLSHLGMRSPAASAIRFFLKQHGYQMALPEVVQLEVEANLQSKLTNFIEEIRNSHEQLLTVLGELREVVLPSAVEVKALIPQLFESVGVKLVRIPFSLESARSSFLKTIHKVQPSNNSQQFKDGVLWADCIALLEMDDVTLVTADQAFYSGHRYENGLAKNLQVEADQCKHQLRVVPSLAKLVEALPKSYVFDNESLVAVLLQKAESNVNTLVFENGFDIGETLSVEKTVFATENPSVLFFECVVSIACENILDSQEPAILRLEADGLYTPETNSFSEVGMLSATFTYLGPDGHQEERRGVYLRAKGLVMGHRIVSSKIRHKLEV